MASIGAKDAPQSPKVRVRMITSRGIIDLELDGDLITTKFFLTLAYNKCYDGATFYRATDENFNIIQVDSVILATRQLQRMSSIPLGTIMSPLVGINQMVSSPCVATHPRANPALRHRSSSSQSETIKISIQRASGVGELVSWRSARLLKAWMW